MKKYFVIILVIIVLFVFVEKQDQKKKEREELEEQEKYEEIYQQGYVAGQNDAIAEIRKEASGWERYVEAEQLCDVLSEVVGCDMRDDVMSYVDKYDKKVIVEEVIRDSGYE